MKYVSISFVLFCIFPCILLGQKSYIEGRLTIKGTNQPISYANIYNISLKRGTISNAEGYFKLAVNHSSDTIKITCIGFETYYIRNDKNGSFHHIQLTERNQVLNAVVVEPKENEYLYELVSRCKKSASSHQKNAKALYELKSFINGRQTELVEGYYNIDLAGYKVSDMHLKAGRVALRKHNDRFFASLESSKAVIMLDIFKKNDYFPTNPLELNKLKLKRYFKLYKNQTYLTEKGDSVFVIKYKPRELTGDYFSGKIWINKTEKKLMKLTLAVDSTVKHPFLPLFSSDQISAVSFHITKTFSNENAGESVFNHIDFSYQITYNSRVGEAAQEEYAISTNVILYAFDYQNLFFQPVFNFSETGLSDYRKINALPYNHFFWTHHDEYKLNNQNNVNELFYNDSSSFTNKTMFKSNHVIGNRLFEHPFVQWSANRIEFADVIPDSTIYSASTDMKTRNYNLAVKIFLDVNDYNDSIHVLTATIFDPYESFYHLPMGKETQCFINLYFDFCEIKRREIEHELLNKCGSMNEFEKLYTTLINEFKTQQTKYFKDVQRGTNRIETTKYNELVWQHLGIGNIEIFKPYPE